MGLFSKIMDRIFHHPQAARPQGGAVTPPPPQPTAPSTPAKPAQPTTPPPSAPVDVEAVLAGMAGEGGGGNWRTSIVDLLKLLDLDSNLEARKELADELGVHAGEAGSAEQNIALHKAVLRKLAENGGRVPDSLLH